MIKQIFLSRALNQQQRVLVDSQQTISDGNGFKNLLNQLAFRIYQASSQDPELANVLKRANLQVHTTAPADATGSPPATTPVPPKAPPAPPHPATP